MTAAVAAAEVARVAAAARQRIDTPCGDGTMPWRVWGTPVPDRAPLVLLHGGSGSWTHWLRNIERFAADRLVLAPDLPGLGDAAELPAPYTVEQAAATVDAGLQSALRRAFRPHAGATTADPAPPAHCHIAAFSWGCTLAGQIAALRGPQVRSLALIGPAAIGPFPLAKMQPLRKRWRGITALELDEVNRHNLGQLMLHDPASIDDLAVHLQIENTNRARFNSPQFARSEILLAALARTDQPLAVVYGEFDGPVYPHLDDRRMRLLRARPDLEFHVAPNAGHWAQYEWAGYNDYLHDWLARHD